MNSKELLPCINILMKKSKKSAHFSTALSHEAKDALTLFCKKRGLKINHFLEELIWDRLEEEMDAEIASGSSRSELVDLKAVRKLVA